MQREPFAQGLRALGWVPGSSLILGYRSAEGEVELPAICLWRLHMEAGGVMSYATSIPEFHRRSATYVDKILKDIRPADPPVEQPAEFELMVNLKTAQALGLAIPPCRCATLCSSQGPPSHVSRCQYASRHSGPLYGLKSNPRNVFEMANAPVRVSIGMTTTF